MQVNSIPACTSYECHKKDASQVFEAQVSSFSDPICSSAGCPVRKADASKNYTVPNFGLDRDIIDSQSHERSTEQKLGHTWNWSSAPTRDEIEDKKLIRPSLIQRGDGWSRAPTDEEMEPLYKE
jgi:hypothetical protein